MHFFSSDDASGILQRDAPMSLNDHMVAMVTATNTPTSTRTEEKFIWPGSWESRFSCWKIIPKAVGKLREDTDGND